MMLVVPGHLAFLYAISLLQGEEAPSTAAFILCYLCAALLQVKAPKATAPPAGVGVSLALSDSDLFRDRIQTSPEHEK